MKSPYGLTCVLGSHAVVSQLGEPWIRIRKQKTEFWDDELGHLLSSSLGVLYKHTSTNVLVGNESFFAQELWLYMKCQTLCVGYMWLCAPWLGGHWKNISLIVQLVEVQANLLPSRKRLDMKTASQNGATKLNVNPLAVCVGRFEKKKVSLWTVCLRAGRINNYGKCTLESEVKNSMRYYCWTVMFKFSWKCRFKKKNRESSCFFSCLLV